MCLRCYVCLCLCAIVEVMTWGLTNFPVCGVSALVCCQIRQRCGVRGGHRALLLDGKDEVRVYI